MPAPTGKNMKKTKSGFGAKSKDDRKRDKQRKKKATTITANWGAEKAKTKETAERTSVAHQPSYEVREIEIADIKIEGKRRSLNAETLNELMESISVLGLQQPITVRVIKRRRNWKTAKREYALVSGFHRLEAKKRLGASAIACFIFEGDERTARMSEISENLHRAEQTPFEDDEQMVEWVKLLEADPGFSGQKVQKKNEVARRAASRKRRVSCQSRAGRTPRSARGWNVRKKSLTSCRK
jgi:hypothetical protein